MLKSEVATTREEWSWGAKKAFSYIKRQMREVNPISRQSIEPTPLWSKLCCSQSKGDHIEYHRTSIGAWGSGRSNAKAACRKRVLDEDYGESAFCNNMTKLNSPNKLLSPIYSWQDTPK
jgi:hypothetical protein